MTPEGANLLASLLRGGGPDWSESCWCWLQVGTRRSEGSANGGMALHRVQGDSSADGLHIPRPSGRAARKEKPLPAPHPRQLQSFLRMKGAAAGRMRGRVRMLRRALRSLPPPRGRGAVRAGVRLCWVAGAAVALCHLPLVPLSRVRGQIKASPMPCCALSTGCPQYKAIGTSPGGSWLVCSSDTDLSIDWPVQNISNTEVIFGEESVPARNL